MLNAILDLLYIQATRGPVLFVVEDLHWCDPSTLELLSLLLSERKKLPIFALFTSRPEFQSAWPTAQLSCLNIEPLSDHAIDEMIKSLRLDISLETILHEMGEAKNTVFLAATLGRKFSIDILRKLSLLGEQAFQQSIERLQESGLISKITDIEFEFRHALFQDAACQSQTRSDRQAAHTLPGFSVYRVFLSRLCK